jgi:hypothetical protein
MITHVLNNLADISIVKYISFDTIVLFLKIENQDENVRKDFLLINQTVDVHKLCELVSKIERYPQFHNNDEATI